MKPEVKKESYNLLYALFLSSTLLEILEDFNENELVIRELKRDTNLFKKKLTMNLTKHLDKAYSIDSEQFEIMDNAISYQAKELGSKTLLHFVRIID